MLKLKNDILHYIQGRHQDCVKLDTTVSVKKIIVDIFPVRKIALIYMEIGKNAINQSSYFPVIESLGYFLTNKEKKTNIQNFIP